MDAARIEQILDWLVKNFVSVVVIFSVFIQITPIKWNPITSFAKWLGKIFTKDLSDQMTNVLEDIQEIRDEIDENEKDRIRWEVLSFANSCRHDQKHTRDEFQHIITLNDKYKILLERTEDKNGVFESEFAFVKNLYDNGDFLDN